MERRDEILTREAPPVRRPPNRFRPTVDRLRLAAMLVREAFHYRFDRRLLLSRPCIYGVFGSPVGGFWPLRHKCVGCMRCVQEYPDMCRVDVEPAWTAQGDSYCDAGAVSMIEFEAATGKIMVKGVGYKGPFSGPGFDSMWTDMSEIVRPTRDGIYGRERISTAVDLGGKPPRVAAGMPEPPCLSVPLPMLFDAPADGAVAAGVEESLQAAAARLGTLFVSRRPPRSSALAPHWVPWLRGGEGAEGLPPGVRMIEFDWAGDEAALGRLRRARPRDVLCARLPLNPSAFASVMRLGRLGVGAFHLAADYHGQERGVARPRFLKDSLLALHRALVKEGLRDELTLISSGGIVRAEHVPKAILCGADLVALDTPLLVALQAAFRGEHRDPEAPALAARAVDPAWGEQRLVNLCASWRDQFLEIASAMGIRDARRMRGETGRAIFVEDAEREWLTS